MKDVNAARVVDSARLIAQTAFGKKGIDRSAAAAAVQPSPPPPPAAPAPGSIADRNERLSRVEDRLGPAHPDVQQVRTERDAAIADFTANPDPSAYDPAIAALAERDGVTYNAAVAAHNQTLVKLEPDADPADFVREMPWESEAVNARVDELMAEEGLGFEASVVLAMTERRAGVGGNPLDGTFTMDVPTLDGEWRPQFADMVAASSGELRRWAEGQLDGAITFVAGDNDITVTMRDGMVVVSDGTTETEIDPGTTERIVIDAGDGDDTITVDPSVTANLVLAGGNGRDFIVGGGGDDIVLGGPGADLVRSGGGGDIVIGGGGDDDIETGDGNDIAFGDAGADVISGGNGNDIVLGGSDRDAIYGGNGTDIADGGAGDDYLDGGRQADLVLGGNGDDTLSGGRGDDELHGGGGGDTLIGAAGTDTFADADTEDTVIRESAETLGGAVGADEVVEIAVGAGEEAITIDPDARPEFRQRVEDDLDTLRATRSGAAMLATLDQAAIDSQRSGGWFNVGADDGNRVVVSELDAADPSTAPPGHSTENGFAVPGGSDWRRAPGEAARGGEDVTVLYNPTTNLDLGGAGKAPPVVILFHEFAHAYNMTTGTGLEGKYAGTDDGTNAGINNTERQAVGLPVDHDGDAATPDVPVPTHPAELTENGLREELGLDPRPYY